MFFIAILLGFVLIGSLLTILDTLLPGFFIPIVGFFIRITGLILIWCGVTIYVGRSISSGGYLIEDLPNPNRVVLLHLGNSGAKLLRSIKSELNSLLVKGRNRMRIKDMGHSINIGGHELQVSSQTVGFTLPLWVLDTIDKWKKKYGVRNKKEFMEVYKGLKDIRDDDSLATIEEKLSRISILKPVMADREKRQELLSMTPQELRNMAECLFDGRTVNAKSYLDWDESANPYDNESIISSTLAHRAEQRSSYRFAGGIDWAKIVFPLMIMLIIGAIAYRIFFG